MTVDHSWVNELMEKHQLSEEESQTYVNKNVITRALGTRQTIKTDISQVKFMTGDVFLLCSDGLTGMVSDVDLLDTVTRNETDFDNCLNELIRKANEAGGADNITVCIAHVEAQKEIESFQEIRRVTVDWGEDAEIDAIKRIIHTMLAPGLGV